MIWIFPLWTFHLYVRACRNFQQHLHMEYISLSVEAIFIGHHYYLSEMQFILTTSLHSLWSHVHSIFEWLPVLTCIIFEWLPVLTCISYLNICGHKYELLIFKVGKKGQHNLRKCPTSVLLIAGIVHMLQK